MDKPHSMRSYYKSPTFLKLFVFINGAAITALEITAARILAPYFGTSLPVWGSIIGVTLIALAVGYELGGRIADKTPKLSLLGGITLIAGLLASVIPWVAKPLLLLLLEALIGSNFVVIVGSLVGSTILFATPIMVMGMVSPFAVRLASEQVSEVGRTAGSLYSIATTGSILGVFLPSFVLIPFLGSRVTVAIFAICEILISVLAIRQFRFLLFLLIPLVSVFGTQPFHADALIEVESPYQFIKVVEKGNVRWMLFNEGRGIQSIYDPSRRLKTDRVWDYAVLFPYFRPKQIKQSMLLIGAAGATVATNIRDHVVDINMEIVGLEIDPVVAHLAREYFDADERALEFRIVDGRLGMKQLNRKFDVILVDAFNQQHYIPPHLATVEFFSEAKAFLSKGGVLVANIAPASTDGPLISAITTTLDFVFNQVWIVRIPNSLNYLVIASDKRDLFDHFSPVGKFKNLTKIFKENRQELSPTGILLTDDRSPIEHLIEWQEVYRWR